MSCTKMEVALTNKGRRRQGDAQQPAGSASGGATGQTSAHQRGAVRDGKLAGCILKWVGRLQMESYGLYLELSRLQKLVSEHPELPEFSCLPRFALFAVFEHLYLGDEDVPCTSPVGTFRGGILDLERAALLLLIMRAKAQANEGIGRNRRAYELLANIVNHEDAVVGRINCETGFVTVFERFRKGVAA